MVSLISLFTLVENGVMMLEILGVIVLIISMIICSKTKNKLRERTKNGLSRMKSANYIGVILLVVFGSFVCSFNIGFLISLISTAVENTGFAGILTFIKSIKSDIALIAIVAEVVLCIKNVLRHISNIVRLD